MTSKPQSCENLQPVIKYGTDFSAAGPVCRRVFLCYDAVLQRARTLITFLRTNGPVFAALKQHEGGFGISTGRLPTVRLTSLIHSASDRGQSRDCEFDIGWLRNNFIRLDSELPVDPRSTNAPSPKILRDHFTMPPFEALAIMGKSLIQKIRADYQKDTAEYGELAAFNDRYAGVEALELAYASYQQAFDADDVAGMLRERPAVQEMLEKARARKLLLAQQSAEITRQQQVLVDIAAAVEHESSGALCRSPASYDDGTRN